MSTIHLVYSSLKRVFDDRKKDTITLLHRRKGIKDILSECQLLPNVIDDIIFEYTDSEIKIDANIDHVRADGDCNQIYLKLTTNDYKIILLIEKNTHNVNNVATTLDSNLELFNNDIGYKRDSNIYISCIEYFNVFMKNVYKKDNYIDCGHDNMFRTYYMKKNNIHCDHSMLTHRVITNSITITNYRKFTYLIVTLKCIINGIQKYFVKNDVKVYCNKN